VKKKRVQNPEAKRDAILSSAAALFVQQGYEATSIAQIASHADVAVGSVYRQFPDKIALLSALHKDLEHELNVVMVNAWDTKLPHIDRFKPMFSALFTALTKRHAILPLMAMTKELIGKENYEPGKAMIEIIKQLYSEGVEAKALKPYPLDIFAFIAHGIVNGGLSAWSQNPTLKTQNQVVKIMSDMMRLIASP
jgi:AcrR family transcriptional regulator